MLLARPTETDERRIPLYRRPGFLRALSPIALLLIWQLAGTSGAIPAKKLPAPSAVLDAGLETYRSGQLTEALLVSGQRALYGFALGARGPERDR